MRKLIFKDENKADLTHEELMEMISLCENNMQWWYDGFDELQSYEGMSQ